MGKTSKVIVCGMKGVGKSIILEQAIYGSVISNAVRSFSPQQHMGTSSAMHCYVVLNKLPSVLCAYS